MNAFSRSLLAAKKKQQLMVICLLSAFVITAIVLLTIIFVSQGTQIIVKPTEASDKAIVEIEHGVAIVIYGTLYSLSSAPEINVSAAGFRSTRQIINQTNFGQVTTVTLEPLPAELILSSSTSDHKTSWFINDEIVTVANTLQHTLRAAVYALRVSHPYFETVQMELTLSAGETLEKTIYLTPIDGSLTVNSVPSGATVSINAVDIGQTPLKFPLSGGLHEVTVKKAGFNISIESIELKNNARTLARTYRLIPKSAAVNLMLQPTDGQLTLNGIVISKREQLSIKAGKNHRLTYSKPGYFSRSKKFTLKANETKDISFSLGKNMGNVEIISTPLALVSIDGKVVGMTPLTLSLNAVNHDIKLSLKGYRSIITTVKPSASSTKKLALNLILESKARLLEAPKTYTNTVGEELVLFTPNDTLTMGAKRDEPGQRANEFVKQVKLSKPFYAGRHEVTNAAYSQFNKNHTGKANFPVTSVSWLDAAKFCNWLSQQEGFSTVYDIQNQQLIDINVHADGYRLLSEAEWEWLARKAGKQKQTIFVWGNDKVIPKKSVNIADFSAKGSVNVYVSRYNDGYAKVAPVKSLKNEVSGLYDLGGNVSEWTHDNYVLTIPKQGRIYTHSLDKTSSRIHVVKGANWRSGSLTELRASFREGFNQQRDDLGFRIGRFIDGGD